MLHNTCCCVRCSHTSLADLTSHSLPLAFGVATNYCGYLWVKCHLWVSLGCWPQLFAICTIERWRYFWPPHLAASSLGRLVDSVAPLERNGWTCCIHSIHSTLPTLTTFREQHLSKYLSNLQKYPYRECQRQKGGKQESALPWIHGVKWTMINLLKYGWISISSPSISDPHWQSVQTFSWHGSSLQGSTIVRSDSPWSPSSRAFPEILEDFLKWRFSWFITLAFVLNLPAWCTLYPFCLCHWDCYRAGHHVSELFEPQGNFQVARR